MRLNTLPVYTVPTRTRTVTITRILHMIIAAPNEREHWLISKVIRNILSHEYKNEKEGKSTYGVCHYIHVTPLRIVHEVYFENNKILSWQLR